MRPTLLNVGYNTSLFHDGRERTLEEQVWGPLLADDEMGNSSRDAVVEQLAQLPDYAGLFERAFAGRALRPRRIGAALAAYQRTLVSGGSRFDRFFPRARPVRSARRSGVATFCSAARRTATPAIRSRRTIRCSPTTSSTTSALGSARANAPPRR